MRVWWIGVVAVMGACGRLSFDPQTGDANVVGNTGDSRGSAAFVDSFDRADQGTVGNGWIENTPGVFAITGNQVSRVASASAWTTNHVYRPPSEDVSDLEVSLELIVTDVLNPDWPQIFVRGDTGESAYYVWVEYGPSATAMVYVDLARQDRMATGWVALDQVRVPTAKLGDRYRLRLSALGFNPVVLGGAYEWWNGTTWQTLVTLSAQDADPKAMASGHWGFSGNLLSTYTYDNYSMTLL